MKKLLAVAFLATFLIFSLNTLSQAQDTSKDLGIGFMVGEPTGLSLKSWTGGNNAFDLGLAWSLGRYDAINIHGDYLWHNYNVFNEVDEGTLPLYYGIGGRLILAENDAIIGARIPVGVNYLFEDSPIGLFLEVAPIINLVPSTDFDVDGGLGVRFYF
jgi:hypothetical protein